MPTIMLAKTLVVGGFQRTYINFYYFYQESNWYYRHNIKFVE